MGRNFDEAAKKKLKSKIEKKFMTSLIGTLDILEDELGEMWGHNMPEEELDEEQLEFRDVWDRIRTRILDKGHLNLRACKNEISQYEISQKKYVVNFYSKGKDYE